MLKTALIKVTLSPIDRCLLYQADNFQRSLFKIGTHVDVFLEMAPICIPKNLKKVEPVLQAKKSEDSCKSTSLTFIQKILNYESLYSNLELIQSLSK